MNHFDKVKNYLLDLEMDIKYENSSEGIFVVKKENTGIEQAVLGCAPPILLIEQYIFEIKNPEIGVYKRLLQKNRDIIHGAFVLDEKGDKVIFRNTLQLDTLDLNELEAAFNSLELLLSEFSDEIIKFSKI